MLGVSHRYIAKYTKGKCGHSFLLLQRALRAPSYRSAHPKILPKRPFFEPPTQC
jgi:hypothetical protein